jgi:hypothetical protein
MVAEVAVEEEEEEEEGGSASELFSFLRGDGTGLRFLPAVDSVVLSGC